jgi:xanthine dehydrogenase molybdopterin-binding subunit B
MQDVNKHHKLVARVLGIPQHKITVKTKRLGGGFGGKETRGAFLHCATAVAAYHTQRPVRLALDRQHDMRLTGHRHAFLGKYKVAADKDGKVLALDLEMYNNAGAHGHAPSVCNVCEHVSSLPRDCMLHDSWIGPPRTPCPLALLSLSTCSVLAGAAV